jgi:hypothetical protein
MGRDGEAGARRRGGRMTRRQWLLASLNGSGDTHQICPVLKGKHISNDGEEAMPSLGRTAVHMTFYALSALALFCASPSAAEPTAIALLRPHAISPITPLTQIRRCPSHERTACRKTRQDCIRMLREAGRTHECLSSYRECIEDCHRGD